jgi:hypothetical protein
VDPASPGPNADSQRIGDGGHLTLAVRATDLGGGRWRYDYALMNFDFKRKIRAFSVPFPEGATVTNATFHDADRDPATDWAVRIFPARITWRLAATGNPRRAPGMPWGTANSFSFEVDAAPSPPQGITADIGVLETRGPGALPGGSIPVRILGPATP